MAKEQTKTIYQSLWNSADILRSKMDASEYKNSSFAPLRTPFYPLHHKDYLD